MGQLSFLADTTFRNGEPAALAVDIVALMDALKIERATLAGFDWGARTANTMRLFGLSDAKRWCL